MNTNQFKFLRRHDGECRVYYKRKTSAGWYALWCMQWDGKHEGVNLYYCTPDGEPEAPALAFPMRERFDRWEWPAGAKEVSDETHNQHRTVPPRLRAGRHDARAAHERGP